MIPAGLALPVAASSSSSRTTQASRRPATLFAAFLALLVVALLTGCGTGGYPGGGITGLSASTLTLDSGQSFTITSTVAGGATVTWSLAGSTCSGATCGAVSTTTGVSTIYTAPAGVTTPFQLTLTGAVAGTASKATVAITVNPDPAIVGAPPAGTVGIPYTTTLATTGGTAPVVLSIASGTLPPGLTFNAATGVISGTPTTAGTYTVTAQAVDSSAVPYTVTAQEKIVIGSPTAAITVSGATPQGTVGVAYTAALAASGGTAPYTFTLKSGALPAGLTLSSTGVISGTPTTAGTSTFTAQATDANGNTGTGAFTITVVNAVVITVGNPPTATAGTPYTGTIPVSGGTAPYTCAITAGSLPAGLTLGANCTITGTPTGPGSTTVTVTGTDSGNPPHSGTGPVTVTVNPAPLTITTGALPNGTVNIPYSATIPVAGGTSPYACSITSGTLPAGLTLASNCSVSGTPTTAGTSTIGVHATDSSSPAGSANGTETITISPASATIVVASPPAATVGTPYTGTIPVSGGTAPYTCAITAGSLPAGLTLGANCTITGTPTTSGSTTITVKGTDSSNPANSGTGPVTITVNPAPLTLTTGTLPNGTVNVPYSASVGVSGGTAPYTCSLVSGTLPAGLTLAANCTVTGTPTTAETTTVSVKATDSANPANTVTGPQTITINPAPLTITTGALPNGTVNVPYSATVPVSGGTSPYACTLTSGTLPAGLTLASNCTVSGTPTTAGTSTIGVHATDSSSPAGSANGTETITISPAPLTITSGALPNGTVGTPYSATIPISGGTAPYTCTAVSGTLPAGLALNANCTVTGTPTTAETNTLNVKVTDSSSTPLTTTGPETVTINAAPASVVIGNPPAATVNTPYTGSIPVSGGTGPYTCTLTAGTIPAGLTLNANCSLTGTPTTAGTTTVTVHSTDSSSPANSGTGPSTITINPATATITLGNPPAATVGTPFAGTIPVSGGTAPYSCTITSGSLPAGLTLGAHCAITGTPTTAGSSTVTVTGTDSSSPANSGTGPVVVTVNPVPALTFTGSLPNGVVGVAYSQTLHASGGIAPYTYAVTAGSLPAGLTLSSAGVVSGTPTTPGASTFTVTATDSESTPMTASLPLTLLITYATGPNNGLLSGPYAFLFQGYDDVVAGVFAYKTATAGSFVADGAGALTAGELDANHQTSNPTGNTVATHPLLGTYVINADYRGSLTITQFNADGTAGATNTYAIAVKPPVAPATTTPRGDLIEFDNNNLVGTKGSGTFLQQSVSAFAAGLTGSYAFGTEGDTPCLPTCTIGIIAGPTAQVGAFTTDNAGAITTGSSDANIASTSYPSGSLSGTYGAADTYGRLQLSLSTSNLPAGVSPTDYAVYLVDSTHAFLISTDKHSAYLLFAGSATQQNTQAFNASSLTGPFVGYENSPTNPGLVGTTLQNTLNLSTATLFQATGSGAGTCTFNDVDVAGTTGVVNALTGLGSGAPILNALLGTYASTGSAACTVASDGRTILNYPNPSTILTGTLSLLGLSTTPPPARVVYLYATGSGYFLETGYAGLGHIEAQSGSPFTLASLDGTFLYGTAPASSLASINSSGTLTSDGAGHITSTQDANVGVGTINVLQLGVGQSGTYAAPDSFGRFVYNSTVVLYEISPGRFVLVDTAVTNTSPSIAILN